MRKKVATTTITYEGQPIHLTGSFGLYSLTDEEITAEKLIERADQQLYKSKKGGKNKVSFRQVIDGASIACITRKTLVKLRAREN